MLYIVYVIIWGNYSEVIRRHPEFHGINDPTWKSNLSDLDCVLSGAGKAGGWGGPGQGIQNQSVEAQQIDFGGSGRWEGWRQGIQNPKPELSEINDPTRPVKLAELGYDLTRPALISICQIILISPVLYVPYCIIFLLF